MLVFYFLAASGLAGVNRYLQRVSISLLMCGVRPAVRFLISLPLFQ